MNNRSSLNAEIDFAINLKREIAHRKRSASNESARQYYQTHLYEYLIERFGERPETLKWSLLPEYENHKWDGTPDPLYKIIDCINNSQWCGIESGKGLSKTYLFARLALAFFDIWQDSIVVTFAPKEEQLRIHLWKEIGILFPKFNKGTLTDLKLKMVEGSEAWTITGFGVGSGAIEQVSQKAAGFHAQHMLMIIEEGPGVNQKVIDAIISTCGSPHNIIVMGGNPDHQLDNLHNFCKLPNVEHIIISGYDFPNVVLNDPNFIPGAQSKSGIERLELSYGSKTNPLFLSHARGISPGSTPESLIQMEWVDSARVTYDTLLDESGELDETKVLEYNVAKGFENLPAIGVDVANSVSGDLAAKTMGMGVVPCLIEDFPCPNANTLGDDVHKDALKYNIPGNRIKIDGVGVGAGTVNTMINLYKYDKGNIDFQGAAQPVELDEQIQKFNNMRSQAWWAVREGLRLGIIPMSNDPETIKDLVAPKWTVANGLTIVESKKDIKKRLGHSPNRGDSFVYWYWNNIYSGITHTIIFS